MRKKTMTEAELDQLVNNFTWKLLSLNARHYENIKSLLFGLISLTRKKGLPVRTPVQSIKGRR